MLTHHMNTIIPRHQSFLHTDRDRLSSAKYFFSPPPNMASRNRTDTVSSTCYPSSMAEAHLSSPTHPTSPRAPLAGVMASAARDVSVSAGPVSTICSEPPPPVSVSRERTACPAPLEFLPIFTLSQTQRGGLG